MRRGGEEGAAKGNKDGVQPRPGRKGQIMSTHGKALGVLRLLLGSLVLAAAWGVDLEERG